MYAVSMDHTSFSSAMEKAQERLRGEILKALERTVELAASYAKAGLQYNHRTYGLRKSITWGTQLGTSQASGILRASAPYAHFVEFGTKPHTIEARRKKTLRFVQNGAVRFARIVRHPGTAPRPFMAQAQERSLPLLERLMGEAVARAFT